MREPRQLTLIADLDDILKARRDIPEGYATRATTADDEVALAHLYFAAYPRDIVSDRAKALEEWERVYSGEYGTLDLAASPIAIDGAMIVASVMTVDEAPWYDTPAGPFIIEVMVHPDHRKRGLATYLFSLAASELRHRGSETVALRVMSDNTNALGLYRKLGFVAWEPGE